MKHAKQSSIGTKKWFYYLSLGIILIIVYKFFDNFKGIGSWLGRFFSVLSPFLIAILISYILYQPCRTIEKFLMKHTKMKKTRGWSITITFAIVILIIVLLMRFIIPILIESINDLFSNLQNYYNAITTNELEKNWAPFIQENVIKPIVDYLQTIDFKQLFTTDKIMTYLNSLKGMGIALFNIAIAIICSIRMLYSKEKILAFIDRFAKATFTENGYYRFNKYFKRGNIIFFNFFASQFIDALVVATLMTISLAILKVKYSILLGIMIGLFNLIPYFGATIAVIIAILVTILTGGWQQALIATIVMIIVSQIDANIINPRITGSKLNTNPLLVVFALTVGGAYFGIIGMFLSVPFAVLIKEMIEDFIKNKEKQKELKEKQAEEIPEEITQEKHHV